MARGLLALGLLVALGACEALPTERPLTAVPPAPAPLSPVSRTLASVAAVGPELEFASLRQRAVRTYGERPFERGALAVLATEGGELLSWPLAPCRDGATVCAGGPDGPAGALRVTPDWHVVTGLYGRTFWLDYGGRGWVQVGDRFVPLAWDSRANGTGDGTLPAMESAAPHS